MELRDKVIVVTGAGKGIGRAITERLAGCGARLAILDLDANGMKETVASVEGVAAQINTYLCDITDEDRVQETFAAIVSDFGRIDGLVNNAGIIRDAQLVKVKDGKIVKRMSSESFDLVVNVHMKGAFLCAREAACYMIESGVEDGVIINMSSMAYLGNFGQTNYSAAKAGMVAMTSVWAKELGRYNIRAMAIAPGTIETDMLRSMPPESLAALESQVPLKRIGKVEHISRAVEHILTNDYLTGSVIQVNGGLSV